MILRYTVYKIRRERQRCLLIIDLSNIYFTIFKQVRWWPIVLIINNLPTLTRHTFNIIISIISDEITLYIFAISRMKIIFFKSSGMTHFVHLFVSFKACSICDTVHAIKKYGSFYSLV